MARISELTAAWKTFEACASGGGWQIIPVSGLSNCRLLAGMAFPKLKRAAIFGFESVVIPRTEHLPSGNGFSVDPIEFEGRTWISLTECDSSYHDLYIAMLEDIFQLVESIGEATGDRIFHCFIDRLCAWQEFMKKGSPRLTIEGQTGLYGELSFLQDLFNLGLSWDAVKAWDGPLGGLHDFRIGFGAIEVKSTVSSDDFIAKIGSLEQLSDHTYKPLYLVGKKLSLSPSGITLPEFINEIRTFLSFDRILLGDFESRLLRVGYSNSHASGYDRALSVNDSLMYEVNENFPRLTPHSVNKLVRSARYEIDIGSLQARQLDLRDMLNKLGVKI